MSDDNVRYLPIKRGARTDTGQILQLVQPRFDQCQHTRFKIDSRLEKVTCRDCGESVSPLYALESMSRTESEFRRLIQRYQDEKAKHEQRSRCKCQHCGKMTRISK